MKIQNTIVSNIQNFWKDFFGGSCYAFCLTKYFGNCDDDLAEMAGLILFGLKKGFIDTDGYVSKPIQYIQSLTTKAPYDVRKISITNLSELPNDPSGFIVEYKLDPKSKASHFVIANNKKVLFDPYGDSNTVKNGKPFTFRAFVYPKGKEGKGNVLEDW